ncbi:MAG: YpdA family putative bacillithiol disulfide reductase [Chitinophagaceae bacterium]|nr:MAG: YpdA family putative bacillithiol disulfide reductase [Chitinophagaceae bacterium]
MAETEVPLIIIGAGPIGLACALEAKKAGIGYLVLEKGSLVNSLFNYPSNMTFFSTSERLEIGDVPFVSNNPKPTRSEALEYYRRVKTVFDLRVNLFEEVTGVENISNTAGSRFRVTSGRARYLCSKIIVCTGFYDIPYLLDVPGENLPKVTHYYKEPHPYAFRKVIVIGSQNSSVDAALETWRKGAEVTMVIRKPEIGTRVKYWVRPDILNRIGEGSIKVYYNSHVTAIRDTEVDIRTPEGELTLPNDAVIATTGYQPNLDFLRKLGIRLSEDEVMCPVVNEASQETNVPGIYLAGVICGGMNTHRLFIENSRVHATSIIADLRAGGLGR